MQEVERKCINATILHDMWDTSDLFFNERHYIVNLKKTFFLLFLSVCSISHCVCETAIAAKMKLPSEVCRVLDLETRCLK